jgi:hypothetical protein
MSVLPHRQHPKLPGYFMVATVILTSMLFALMILRSCASTLAGW